MTYFMLGLVYLLIFYGFGMMMQAHYDILGYIVPS